MYLQHRLLAIELRRNGCWKDFLHYQKTLDKCENNALRIKFLENCKRADLIPNFLKFRIPTNGCFDENSIHDFQKRLLHKETIRAKENRQFLLQKLNERRTTLRDKTPAKCIPSIVLYTRIAVKEHRQKQTIVHDKKLSSLSEDQERPLFSVKTQSLHVN